jgi:GTP-binding protein LepA
LDGVTLSQNRIRNFCIIAHIDHGKSTLADRLLERTDTIAHRQMANQVLDQMDLEREKGITIKAQAVRMIYVDSKGEEYQLNLIDTPGHVDFTYEVSRSLAACEGAILVVDAVQGVEAQTLANVYLALEHDLSIVPVVNKIDLPSANREAAARQVEEIVGLPAGEVIYASAKEGTGIDEILDALVHRVPPPHGNRNQPLRALIFDSHYDSYKGVIAYVRVVDGAIKSGDRILMMATGQVLDCLEVGVFRPRLSPVERLETGEVGYVATGLKNVRESQVGDTITHAAAPAEQPLSGYRPIKPMVFAGLYPVVGEDYGALRDALDRLRMNDGSLSYEPENSAALGFGFRCGFLGMLHLEIVQERLEREYDLDLLVTSPSVEYRVFTQDGREITVDSPSKLPPSGDIAWIEEPWVRISIIMPSRYIGTIMEMMQNRRSEFLKMDYLDEQRVLMNYDMPFSEMLIEFYDEMKTRTQGYASLDYTHEGYRESKLVKLDILVNEQQVDALSMLIHTDKAYYQGRSLVQKLRELIPRQMFEVPIQATIGSKVIARETIRAMRKNVLAKCYGGDITRKRKLLENQAKGKKRMKRVGSVDIPQEAFMSVLKL